MDQVMGLYEAISVDVDNETAFDYGEGCLSFQWADPLYGEDGLNIDHVGHCSRNMQFRSGKGPPQLIDLQRDYIRLRFNPELAAKLELPEEIEIRFNISDENFVQLQRAIVYSLCL